MFAGSGRGAGLEVADFATWEYVLLTGSAVTADLLQVQNLPAKSSEEITVEGARALVQQVEADSRFGILQLSGTYEISPEAAAVIAQFRGEMLILGLKSLSPEIARAIADSQAATVWLHSLTSVAPEAAEALAQMPAQLLLSGLVELDSVPLAEAVGALTVPRLKSLDSLPLTQKLAAGVSQSVLLPAVSRLSVEQAQEIASFRRGFQFGGMLLSLTAMTEEVATVFANNPGAGRLELVGGPLSDPPFRILAQSPLSIGLRDVESLNSEQVRILATAADSVPGFVTQGKISLPRLTTPDSPLLAETQLRCSSDFDGVRTILPESAAALARFPGTLDMPLTALDSVPFGQKIRPTISGDAGWA